MRSNRKATSMRNVKDMRSMHALPRHQIALVSCREELQKSLTVDFFKTHPFFFTTNLDSDLDVVSMFLDNMEQSDESTFNLFMDMLRSYNRTAFHQLEQTLASIDTFNDDDDDDDCYLDNDALGERVAMSGHMVKELLRRKMKMKSSDNIFKNNPMAHFDVNKNDNYLACFVINSRGDEYQRPWIKHDSTRKKKSKNKNNTAEPYMAVVCRNMFFKMISEVPPFVRKPVNCSQIYIFDEQSMYSPVHNNPFFFDKINKKNNITEENNFVDFNNSFKSQKWNNHITKRFVQSPPPLPPKPDTLSPCPTMSFNEKPTEFSNQQIISENKKDLQQRPYKTKLQHNISQISLPPPIPCRQKSDFISKPPPASPPIAINSTLSRESSSKRSKGSIVSQSSKTSLNHTPVYTPQNPLDNVESDDGSDDNISLSYNVEPENSDDLEEPYEPINPYPPPPQTKITPQTSILDNAEHLCADLSGKQKLDSNINNNDSAELGNYTNSSIENNDTCNQSNQNKHSENFLVKNTKHDYLILEANDHDLQGNNHNDQIKDENNCSVENKSENGEDKNKKNVGSDLKNIENKDNNGDFNQMFSDCERILENLTSSEIDLKKNDISINRSSSIKSEPAIHKNLEVTIKPMESQKINSLKSKANREIMELSDEHLMTNRMSESSKNSFQAATSVSRSSSGISATVSEKMATRDSGVDSTVSQSLHESPFCAKEPTENIETIVPETVTSKFLDNLMNSNNLSEPSYYEDIDHIHAANLDSLSQSHYLDPRMDYSKEDFTLFSTNSNLKKITEGSLLVTDGLLVTTETDFSDYKLSCKNKTDLEKHYIFSNTVIGYDKDGIAYYVPLNCIKKHGDPSAQPWFYPIPLTIKEASVFLKQEQQKGCFIVYKFQEEAHIPEGCVYFLGLYGDEREVLHYPIVENVRGDLMIDGDDKSFLNVCDLVRFYKRNRYRLATRLRRCLKESRLSITPGHHYPSNFELSRKSINMSSKVICEGRFGSLYLATLYRQQKAMVRLFQRESIKENEDDFLSEALVLMKVNHKNIIKLIGVCFKTRPYYIVFENFGSGTLKDVLSYGSLPLDRNEVYYDICLQMTAALVYLESLNFVLHRDVSSSNFLISSDNSIKLFNFERACQVDDNSYEGDYDEEIPVRWAAPEVLADYHYSTKSDVWALAVVFWELFSHGLQPYHCMSEQQVIVSVIEKCKLDKPVDCDIRMFNIMLNCWKFKPSSRLSFSMLEERLKGQSSVYYMTSLKKPGDMLTSLNSFESLKHNPLLPNKPNKRSSQSSPTTPVVFGSAFQFRNSNHYTDGEMKGEDAMKISQIFAKTSKRNTLSSRIHPPFVDSSSSVHLSNENVSRASKERKSIRNIFRNRKNA